MSYGFEFDGLDISDKGLYTLVQKGTLTTTWGTAPGTSGIFTSGGMLANYATITVPVTCTIPPILMLKHSVTNGAFAVYFVDGVTTGASVQFSVMSIIPGVNPGTSANRDIHYMLFAYSRDMAPSGEYGLRTWDGSGNLTLDITRNQLDITQSLLMPNLIGGSRGFLFSPPSYYATYAWYKTINYSTVTSGTYFMIPAQLTAGAFVGSITEYFFETFFIQPRDTMTSAFIYVMKISIAYSYIPTSPTEPLTLRGEYPLLIGEG